MNKRLKDLFKILADVKMIEQLLDEFIEDEIAEDMDNVTNEQEMKELLNKHFDGGHVHIDRILEGCLIRFKRSLCKHDMTNKLKRLGLLE